MRLKRLEIYGYKSFAKRVVFDFDQGITAIVGPNGSGKSNVADAVRWVLGEQSYSRLRARRTSDMIFAGSSSRSRLGMAEVLVTLDNTDGWLPLDYSEVTIGRRAYRSGENEYLLNGSQVRFRDIRELLDAVGLTEGSYIVIGQGLIDAALSLRPEERRSLFEDAAGIASHLRKREGALERIQETNRNLERVQDILAELRPRAATLRHQAERAEEHQLLNQDLQELHRILYGHRWQQTQRQLTETKGQRQRNQKRLEAQRHYSRSLAEKREQLKIALEQQREHIEGLRQRTDTCRQEKESLTRQAAVATERRRLLREQESAAAAEMQALESRAALIETEVEQATEQLAAEQLVHKAAREELQAAQGQLAQMEQSRRAIREQIEESNQARNRLLSGISQDQARDEQLQEEQQRLRSESEAAERRISRLGERLQEMRQRAQELAARENAHADQLTELQKKRATTEEELTRARQRLDEAAQQVSKRQADVDHLTAQHRSLSRLRQQMNGYYPGVRHVLRAQERLGGILGTVATLMRVPKQFEQAIESALGSRLQNVVTERWKDAERAIEDLKEHRSGWATFLPLDTIHPRGTANAPKPDDAVVGVASELVDYDPRLRSVFQLLLGRIIVVRHLPAARRLLRQSTGASLLVTLDGETVQPSGAVSGGTRRNNSNLLAQERQWRQLPSKIAAEKEELEAAQQEQERQGRYREELRRELATLEEAFAQARDDLQRARERHSRQVQDTEDVAREKEWEEKRIAQMEGESAELKQRRQQIVQRVARAQEEQDTLERELGRLREKLAQSEDDELRKRVARLETRAAVAQRTVESQQQLLDSHKKNLHQIRNQIRGKEEQRQQTSRRLEQLRESDRQISQRIEQMDSELGELRNQLQPAQDELVKLRQQQDSTEQRHAQSLERLREAEADLDRANLQHERVLETRGRLAEEIHENLGPVDLPDANVQQLRLDLGDSFIELPDVEQLPHGLEEEIRQLKGRIRRLGSINPQAPREYNKLLDRQTFLQSQMADLRGAIASLHEVIEELDEVIEHDFETTFVQVNQGFQECFQKLFGGGKARLQLTNPDDLSTTGVEIIARPPGKRAQRLSLLSGGERSLTAAALLFALLRANPVPFCFLDEVDAALDEANVQRFGEMLAHHAEAAQFAVITHNRHTIEKASTVYGVSMEEEGVSETVSLKINHAQDPAHAVSSYRS